MSLLLKIDRYPRRTGMPPTKFGRLAVNDPRLIGDLRAGRTPRGPMRARIEAFVREEA